MADAPTLPKVFSTRLSGAGISAAALFFALSLTPTLIPRSGPIQGALSGITMALGYGVGVGLAKLWRWLGLPAPGRTTAWQVIGAAWLLVLAWVTGANVWRHVGWQNETRELFGMDALTPVVWLIIIPVALATFAALVVIGRSVRKLFARIVRLVDRALPRRAAVLVGTVVLGLLLWGLWSGVVVNGFFAAANLAFAPLDARIEEGVEPPTSALRSGGPGSLVTWEQLGRSGRQFVAGGPTVEDLDAFSGGGALEPIRVYAGLETGPTPAERATVLLEELIRTDAFGRQVLVIGTTTGTGKLVAAGIDPLEYLHNGDTAVVGIQYSYLPSWMSLLGDHDEVRDAAKATFDVIHGYWSTLPEDRRPELYVYGLSLGTLGVESILTSIDIVNEPIEGALLVGPTFVNDLRHTIVDGRDAGSSPVVPIYRQGRTVRFTTETNALDQPTGDWGDTRIAYVVHGSDPIGFFSIDLLWSEPDWLQPGQRGADVAEDVKWVPIVTMWQVLSDLAAAGSVPNGFGHEYSAPANADGWIAITEPEGWTEEDSERLDAVIADLGQDR